MLITVAGLRIACVQRKRVSSAGWYAADDLEHSCNWGRRASMPSRESGTEASMWGLASSRVGAVHGWEEVSRQQGRGTRDVAGLGVMEACVNEGGICC